MCIAFAKIALVSHISGVRTMARVTLAPSAQLATSMPTSVPAPTPAPTPVSGSIPAPPLGAWVLGAWVSVAMIAVVPAVLVYATQTPVELTWMAALVPITLSGLRYGWLVAAGERRLYEMTFWVFTYVFLGVAPLAQLRTGQTPATTPRIDTTLNLTAIWVIIVGVAAFSVGLLVSRARGSRATTGESLRGVDLTRTLILAFCALAIDGYFIASVGVGTLFTARDELARTVVQSWSDSSTSALLSALTSMSLLVAFIALVKYVGQTASREWPLIALTVVVGLALAITVNPISNARYVFGTGALAVAALFGLFATSVRFRTMAVLWVAVLIVLFPIADAFRYSAAGELKTSSILESLTSPDFDAYAQINNTVLFVDRHGVTNGEQAAGVVLFWVPRSIWPDKPRDTGIVLSDSRDYGFQNLSAPIWAEFYINGGWIVLVCGMATLGALVGFGDQRIEKSLQRARSPGILACILPFYLMILLRGSLLQAMSYLTVILAASLFVTRWKRVS